MSERGRARLFSPVGESRGAVHEIAGEATVGRGAEHTIALDHRAVSKDHARIVFDGDAGCFVLEDLGSTNGTTLDGIPVQSRERLGHLHVITFAGQHEFVFQDLARCATRHGPPLAPAADGDDTGDPLGHTRATPVPPPVPDVLGTTGVSHLPPPVPTALAGNAADETAAGAAADTPADDPLQHTRVVSTPPPVPGVFAAPGDEAGNTLDETAAVDAPADDPLQHTRVVSTPPPVPGVFAAPGDETGNALDVTTAVPPERYGTREVALDPGLAAGRAEPPASPAPPPAPPTPAVSPTTPVRRGTEPATAGTGSGPIPVARYRLEVRLEDGVRRFPLRPGDNVIGRGRGAEVRLKSEHLSRRHAVLRVAGDLVTLRDEGSRNHTFLEDQRIGTAVPIEPGDRLRFGALEARLIDVVSETGGERG